MAKGGSPSAVVQNEQVRAELVAHAPDGVGAGKPVWLGLQIKHQPHWHTYWKNPGDSGLPTVLQWTLPSGVVAGDIAWPTPQRIPVGTMANYGFSDTILLPVPLTIASDFQPTPGGDLEVRLNASWLVCRQECIPQDGNFVLRVPAKGSTASHAADFEAARAAGPTDLPGTSKAQLEGNSLTITVSGLPANWQGRALQPFPETPNIAEPVTSPQTADKVGADGAPSLGKQVWNNGVWSGSFPLSVQREGTADQLPIVLALGTQSLRTVATISGTWPPLGVASPALVSP
ncbi:MAG TPA: protein-disulfide reductase DsbD family protein, partial [Rhodoferax sp.]|nr:protein-disulfide reductase DsbD family protein [Rhodoferax sp.]